MLSGISLPRSCIAPDIITRTPHIIVSRLDRLYLSATRRPSLTYPSEQAPMARATPVCASTQLRLEVKLRSCSLSW